MPNSVVKDLMVQVTNLRVAVASIKADIESLKRLVYLGVGVGATASAGVIVQIVVGALGK